MKKEVKSKIFNVIILDKSGSMSSIRNQAVDGVNETLGAIRVSAHENPATEQYVTLVAFCGCELNTIIDTQIIDTVENITLEQYNPCCMTPLYDAIGNTITKLHKVMEGLPASAASVTIITDGYENASREFTFNTIKALIESYKEEGWLFAYIGAEHDVETVAATLAITNTLCFSKDSEGVRKMMAKSNESRSRWALKASMAMNESPDKSSEGIKSRLKNLVDNYFDE